MLTTAERNYSVTKRQALGMIFSLQKFRHYLLANQVFFHVDHQALLFLIKRPHLTVRLARWMLLLQEFDFVIIHTLGNQHAVADYLSRIENGEDAIGISDQLLDLDLFAIQAWNSDSFHDQMLLFLTDGLLPEDMTID